jgi:hypothetical protein
VAVTCPTDVRQSAQNVSTSPAIPHLFFACVGERPILDAEGLATPFDINT